MNRLPNRIRVNGIEYKVKVVKRLEDNDNSLWGISLYKKNTIKIRKGLTNQKQQQTLMHELTHVMFHEMGLDEQADDEKLVNQLGNAFYQLLADNPNLRKMGGINESND